MTADTRHPEKPLLGYFGHHKCGSTWVYHILRTVAERLELRHFHAHGAYAFDRDLAAARRAQRFDLITYVNANYHYLREIEVQGVHVVRDPRDLLVSAYFSHRYSHPVDNWPELERFRAQLEGSSVEQGLILELDFCQGVLEDIRGWPEHPAGILTLRFEEMLDDELDAYRRICSHLGLLAPLGEPALAEIVTQYSFENLSGGRRPGETDNRHHYRQGTAGDWKNHFTPAVSAAFRQRYSDLLLKYGYEKSVEWEA